jgi:multicomponent Na+:H+ antiporter subunit C
LIFSIAIAAGALVAAGVFLATSKDLLRCVVGVSLIGSGANLVVLSAGRFPSPVPAFVEPPASVLAAVTSNPLPQALVLTAIVIGFALTSFSLILALAIRERTGAAESGALSEAEPPPLEDGSPALITNEE